jgi:DNA-binding transcriptional LysR family regulator
MNINIPTDVLRTFVAIADTGSFTLAADQVFRTQSAVSQQVNKLEQMIGKELFVRDGRSIYLSPDGNEFVGYARRILKLHDEAVSVFTEPYLEGLVRFGIPDDYVEAYLPRILSSAAEAFPRIQFEIECQSSEELVAELKKCNLDIILITNRPGFPKGDVVSRQEVVWVTSPTHFVHEEDPLPVALFEATCSVRQAVLEKLDKMGRNYRMAYSSPNHAGLTAAIKAGLAVTALARCAVPAGLRELTPEEGFPALPASPLALLRKENRTQVIDRVGDHILESFNNGTFTA